MALKAVVDSLDSVDEGQHNFYTEKEGKFYLDLEGVQDHPDVGALKRALDGQRERNKKLVEENKQLKERVAIVPEGFDPDELAQLRAKVEEYEADPSKRQPPDQKAAQEAVAARRLLEQKMASTEKAHATEIGKLRKQLEEKDTVIGRMLVEDGLTKALTEVGVTTPQFLRAAKAMLKQDIKVVVDEGGEYRAVVETDTGPLDIPKYVSDWAASDEGKPFVPPPRGGDAVGGNKQTVGKGLFAGEANPWSKEGWNLTKQGQILRADRGRAEKMARAAGKSIPPAV